VSKSIADLQREIEEWGKEKGWADNRTFSDYIALFHDEISEAFEEWRNGREETEIYFVQDEDKRLKPEGVPIELADEVIRILHWFARKGLDLETAIEIKQQYNRGRPYRHGGKRI
jgi:hypothetical protein